jgi:hypothetical protein
MCERRCNACVKCPCATPCPLPIHLSSREVEEEARVGGVERREADVVAAEQDGLAAGRLVLEPARGDELTGRVGGGRGRAVAAEEGEGVGAVSPQLAQAGVRGSRTDVVSEK